MALTKSFLQRRELTIPVTKERCAASSSEFLPIWVTPTLLLETIAVQRPTLTWVLPLPGVRFSQAKSREVELARQQKSASFRHLQPNPTKPFLLDVRELSFNKSGVAVGAVPGSARLSSATECPVFTLLLVLSGAAAACSHDREISPIPDQEERRTLERQALEEEAIAIAELQEDEESFAVGAMPEPGQYRYEPFDQEEVLSRPHQPRFFQEPKNLKDFSWVAEDESFQVLSFLCRAGLLFDSNLRTSTGAFSSAEKTPLNKKTKLLRNR
eukprot:2409978-Rhodomonas_salina.3